jgi:hypothetical protein
LSWVYQLRFYAVLDACCRARCAVYLAAQFAASIVGTGAGRCVTAFRLHTPAVVNRL